VPFLRHDYTSEKWKSIARIYLTGWREFRYIPNLIAAPFMEETIYGNTYTSLTESFLSYVDQDEKEVLEMALNDFQPEQTDELVNVLDAYDCRKLPTRDNLHDVIKEIDHKLIIQTPMFVIDCWRSVLGPMAFDSHASFMAMYDSLIPSTKIVKNNLILPEKMAVEEKQSAKYIKKFVAVFT
jgi:hypothetical protein